MTLLVRGEVVTAVESAAALPARATILSDGTVVVEDGRIVDVGPHKVLRAQYPGADELGSAQHLVLPGFVDAHDHARGLGHMQGGVGDEALETWLLRLDDCLDIGPYLAALWTGLTLIESGVTTVMHDVIPPAHGTLADGVLAALRAYDELGLRVALGVPFFDQGALSLDEEGFLASLPAQLRGHAESWAQARAGLPMEEYTATVAELQRICRQHYPRARLLVSPGGPWRCSDATLVRLTEWARSEGLGRHLHLLETRYQRALGVRCYGGRTLVQVLADLDVLGPDLTCAHGVWLTAADIALLAEAGVSVVHNPSSNLRLRSGIAPVPAMLAAGINVGLGLDGIALNDDQDFVQEMRLCASLHAYPGVDAPALNSAQVLHMATAGGARAVLGHDTSAQGKATCGQIKAGAPADLILVHQERMRAPYTHPRIETLDLWLRRGKAEDVESVIVDGRVVMRTRRLSGVDRREIAGRVAEAAERALRDAREPPPWRDALLQRLRHFYQDWVESPVEPYDARNSRV